MTTTPPTCDLAIIGCGAAGLFASIWAARHSNGACSIIALDGAAKLGAKILVAGGGRCNVTHHAVDERAYAGSSPNAIKKVLRQFTVEQTVQFFRDQGVELKREDTGKLFPVTDSARTVLDALLSAARDAGIEIANPWRVASVTREQDYFVIHRDTQGIRHSAFDTREEGIGPPPTNAESRMPNADTIRAHRIILATGGKSLPKTGSDGTGHEIAKSLGHTITPRVFPALVPLTLHKDHWLCTLSGLTMDATIELRAGTGKRLKSFTNSTLLTHFGVSGPGVLDISRYFTAERATDPASHLIINWIPALTFEQADQQLEQFAKQTRGTPARWLTDHKVPERFARAMCDQAHVDAGSPAHTLTRDKRRALITLATQCPLPITGDRGWLFAEVTAGGVPLSEVHLETMESRVCPGLYLCGEVLDVDGRIGGFNFQWAWASGYVAGRGATNSRP